MKFSDRVRSLSDNLDLFQSSESIDLRPLLDCCQQVNAKLARLLNDVHPDVDNQQSSPSDPEDDPKIQRYIDKAEEYFKDWEEAAEGTIRRQIIDLIVPHLRSKLPFTGDPSPKQQEEIDSFYRKMLTEILNEISPLDTLDKLLDLDKKIQGDIEDSTSEQRQVVPKLQGFINDRTNRILTAVQNPAISGAVSFQPYSDVSELLECCSHLVQTIEQCKGKLCSISSGSKACDDTLDTIITPPPPFIPSVEDIVRRFSS